MVTLSSKLIKKSLASTDERSKLEGELLAGIEVVKCSTWEESFWSKINAVRNTELAILWKSFIISSVNTFLLNVIPTIVQVTTFGAYVLLGNELTAAKAVGSLHVQIADDRVRRLSASHAFLFARQMS